MSDLKTVSLFDTFVYQAEIPKYLDNKDFIACKLKWINLNGSTPLSTLNCCGSHELNNDTVFKSLTIRLFHHDLL